MLFFYLIRPTILTHGGLVKHRLYKAATNQSWRCQVYLLQVFHLFLWYFTSIDGDP